MSQHNEKNSTSAPVTTTRFQRSETGGWTHWHLRTDLIVQRLNRHRQVHNLPPQGSLKAPDTRNEKLNSLEDVRKGSENYALTTNQGVRIADDQNSLRAGSRGPTLLEDFILREKITHFDHERIPERIVHARGSAAHGYFQPYKSLSDITKADFLSDPNKNHPSIC